MTVTRAIGAIGLLLILTYAKVQLMPFFVFAALCGALVTSRKQGDMA